MANRVVVAGGGASGLSAAIFAARNGAEVTILEHKDRVGKKILMTGNGRCNLTNMSDVRGKYHSSDAASLIRIYDTLVRFDAMKTRDFFKGLGLYTKEKRDGGVYPVSEQASVVLDVLRSACDRLGVRIWTDCEITAIKPDKADRTTDNATRDKACGTVSMTQYKTDESVSVMRYKADETVSVTRHKADETVSATPCKTGGTISVTQYVRAGNGQGKTEKINEILPYDKLILATGGKAAPVSGSDGSGYALAKRLGHSVIEPLPALVQLKCEGKFFKALSGVRAQAKIRLLIDGKVMAIEEGELQLTDYGISGIPVFQFSRLAARALYDGKQCEARIDFIPYIKEAENELCGENIETFSDKTVEALLSGLVHKKIAAVVCKLQGIGANMTVGQAGAKKVSGCIRMLADFCVKITAPNSFDNAQVCSGGVPLGEVDENFASYRCPGIYIVGELLDCDGICGGYNLQWAWATGAIAGADAALRENW